MGGWRVEATSEDVVSGRFNEFVFSTRKPDEVVDIVKQRIGK